MLSIPILDTIVADGPHPELGEHAATYGRLVGSWTGTLYNHMTPGGVQTASIEIHFAWVLEGRAIQDVWITPARPDRERTTERVLDWYGTTLRTFDAKSGVWRARWLNPVTGFFAELDGRRQGDDIVQLGSRAGRPIRWTFSRITAESFVWQGHVLEPDGITWRLEVEIRARRMAGDHP